MAKLEFKGMDKYIRQLNNVAWATRAVAKAAVYAGADVVANEIRKGMEGLSTVTNEYAMRCYQLRKPCYISDRQLKALLDSFGVARIQTRRGYINTKLGYDGYNSIKTRAWPYGQPNAMIARSCNNGSTAMIRQPFLDSAVARARDPAIRAMDKAANDKTLEILGGK